jgi:SAM-dependent methyltransferase
VTSYRPVRDAYSAKAAQYIELLGGDWQPYDKDAAIIRRHLGAVVGPVLDLGCGPGYWAAYLHARGVDVTGIDLVPEFIDHARATHPGPEFRLGSMTDVDVPDHSVAGILSWYSTIHLPPRELDDMLRHFRRLLKPDGVLVIGFFDSDDDVAAFDHKVMTAYRRPVDVFAEHLTQAGFTERERVQYELSSRPNRKYAAIAARAHATHEQG